MYHNVIPSSKVEFILALHAAARRKTSVIAPARGSVNAVTLTWRWRLGWGGPAMHLDPIAIADALAEIASRTKEPETARQLMELVERLLSGAGLPPEDPAGGSAN